MEPRSSKLHVTKHERLNVVDGISTSQEVIT